MGTFEDLAEAQRKMEQQIKEQGEAAMVEYFRDVFAAYPELHGVQWEQYTPYFNDGDECIFGVHEPEFDVTGEGNFVDSYDLYEGTEWSATEPTDAPGGSYVTDTGREGSYRFHVAKNAHPAYPAVSQVSHDLQANDQILKFAFGDHAQITVTREGIKVTEYQDHY